MTDTASQTFRIVVAVDGSDAGHSVIERALDSARRFDCDEVHFLRVVSGRAKPGQLQDAHESLAKLVVEKLSDFATPDDPGPRARAHATAGNPAEEILQLAADVQARLIVIGRHGQSGRLRDKFGTVPGRVIRDASCAVLVEQTPEYAANASAACAACVVVRRDSDGDRWFCDDHTDDYQWKSSALIAASFTSLHGVS